MLLQVHDELVFECPPEEVEAVSPLVKREMEGVYAYRSRWWWISASATTGATPSSSSCRIPAAAEGRNSVTMSMLFRA